MLLLLRMFASFLTCILRTGSKYSDILIILPFWIRLLYCTALVFLSWEPYVKGSQESVRWNIFFLIPRNQIAFISENVEWSEV